MEAVTLRHVDKSYTTYGTEVVLTGQVRPSRTRQVLRDVSVSFPAGSLTAIAGRSALRTFDLADVPYPRDPESHRLRDLKRAVTEKCLRGRGR